MDRACIKDMPGRMPGGPIATRYHLDLAEMPSTGTTSDNYYSCLEEEDDDLDRPKFIDHHPAPRKLEKGRHVAGRRSNNRQALLSKVNGMEDAD